uniref:Uncharacterized protein n=1 Tax=Arundo donax TaxID=35708 RepID=A0A0A8Z1Q5_ARUDO
MYLKPSIPISPKAQCHNQEFVFFLPASCHLEADCVLYEHILCLYHRTTLFNSE